MKTSYTDTTEEYTALREACGLIDYEGMGLVRVSGPAAAEYLGRAATRGVDFLLEGQSTAALLLRENGTVIAEVLIHCHAAHYLVEIWPSQAAEATAHLIDAALAYEDVTVQDVSAEYRVLALEGPASFKTAQRYLPFPVASMAYRSFATAEWGEGQGLAVSRTGVTGEYGYKFFAPAAEGARLRAELLADGAVECGKDALDVCRMEVRFASLEHESAGHEVTPFDLGLQWMVDPGREVAGPAAERDGALRSPVCWIADESLSARPEQGTAIAVRDAEVGVVTHAVRSPRLGRIIGTGRVDAAVAASGQDFQLAGSDTAIRTVSAPFLTATSLDVPLD
ncbi:glycine cleavage T C-terminal barrel domain-containing protein [Streptomyces alboniger]|uniref:Aminomethyl transferase family protein n=1 Tax=Streptomyces alboniger TaxID=132473 RepID=A0A5J6HTZ1_STRAD|nr:glycine cleavage T C-terminal barrel domain-containing protein [Streptomyces alboniger]QEV21771.1 aminomethyl transferase family protein [Streptomyces alboniger]